jgi:hypothetical protein
VQKYKTEPASRTLQTKEMLMTARDLTVTAELCHAKTQIDRKLDVAAGVPPGGFSSIWWNTEMRPDRD